MLSGLSSFLFGNQRKDDDKKKPVPPPETKDKGEWLLVNSSGDTVDIDPASTDASPTTSGAVCASSGGTFRAGDATAASGALTASGASLLEDTLTDESLPCGGGDRDHFAALTVDTSHHHQEDNDNFHCSSSTLSTPAKSDTSSSDDVSDFERYRGPYVSMRDLESHSDAGLSDVSSQPEHVAHPSMDEEWLVTPPPCFTSPAGRRGSAAAAAAVAEKPATSSLENLLIEHPSMSVYYPSAGRGGRRLASPLSSVMSDSRRSENDTDSLTSEDNESLFGAGGGEHNREERRFSSPPEWRPAAVMPGLEIAQRGGVPRPIHHQPVIDLLATAGGTDVAMLEWKGKTRVERRVLSRSAIDQNNRVRNHDAQFKLRRQREHARGLPTNRCGKGKF